MCLAEQEWFGVNMGFWGESILVGVFLLYGFAAVLSLVVLKLRAEKARKVFLWARCTAFAAAGLSAVAFALLIAAFLRDDFSVHRISNRQSRSVDSLCQ